MRYYLRSNKIAAMPGFFLFMQDLYKDQPNIAKRLLSEVGFGGVVPPWAGELLSGGFETEIDSTVDGYVAFDAPAVDAGRGRIHACLLRKTGEPDRIVLSKNAQEIIDEFGNHCGVSYDDWQRSCNMLPDEVRGSRVMWHVPLPYAPRTIYIATALGDNYVINTHVADTAEEAQRWIRDFYAPSTIPFNITDDVAGDLAQIAEQVGPGMFAVQSATLEEV